MRDLVCERCHEPFRSVRPRQYCSRTCSNRATSPVREDAAAQKKAVTLWSCGGGVQSAAVAVLIVEGKLPRPDLAVMVDVGYETAATWRYVDEVIRPGVGDVGVTLEIVKTTDWASNDLFDRTGHLVIPAYKEDGGRLATHCSGPWKVRVVKRWLRSLGVERCEDWVGISADEAQRARPSGSRWFSNRYPLVEAGMTREDCLWAICGHGWPKPMRTSCVMCPQRSAAQWRGMKESQPDEWDRACEIDEEIRARGARAYLHRSLRPLREALG